MIDDPDPELSVYQWRLCEIIEALKKNRKSPVVAGLLQMALLELEIIRRGLDETAWKALTRDQDTACAGAHPGAPLSYPSIYVRLKLEFSAA